MYAVALWDDAEGTLALARDPFGIKPLYIADDGETLRFASQVKALVASGDVRSILAVWLVCSALFSGRWTKVLPVQHNEFVCKSCFLVKHRSQLADRRRTLCRDCA